MFKKESPMTTQNTSEDKEMVGELTKYEHDFMFSEPYDDMDDE